MNLSESRGMLAKLFDKLLRRAPAGSDDLLQLVERAVVATYPRLSLLPGYRKALTPCMRSAMSYIHGMLQHLPDPLELSLLSFTLDRRLGLFFSSPSSLLSLLQQDPVLLDFFRSASQGDDVYALLLMERTDSLRFGMANQDGEIRADVAQTVVSFDHHRLALACASMAELRAQLPERALELLLQVISHRLALLERERSDLECELTQVKMHLSALANPGLVLVNAMPAEEALPQGRQALLLRQDVLQKRLSELKASGELSAALGTIGKCWRIPIPVCDWPLCPCVWIVWGSCSRMRVIWSSPIC